MFVKQLLEKLTYGLLLYVFYSTLYTCISEVI